MNPSALYQTAILRDNNQGPSASSTAAVRNVPLISSLSRRFLFCQNAPTHVRSTSAHHPFTSEFVQAQLSLPTDRSRARARALYNERVRRRQLVLAEKSQGLRNPSPRRQRKGEERKREVMGRREAAEKGLWRLRKEEARCVCVLKLPLRARRKRRFCLMMLIVLFALRWDLFVPLHRLWLGYMSELLALSPSPPLSLRESAEGDVAARARAAMPQAAGMHAKLVKADLHGSIMIGQFIFGRGNLFSLTSFGGNAN